MFAWLGGSACSASEAELVKSQWVVSVPTCDIDEENKLNDDDGVTEIGCGEVSKLCA